MEPALFSLSQIDDRAIAGCENRIFRLNGNVPLEFAGALKFTIAEDARKWEDLIPSTVGISLFSENVVSAFSEEGISGLKFCPAEVSTSLNWRLRKQPQPQYFWGRAEGVVEVDWETYRNGDLTIPLSASPRRGVDVYHLSTPSGVRSYVCTRRVVETIRKHKIGNARISPLDYSRKRDPQKRYYEIDLSAKEWPPASWYPEGYVPHPSNDINLLLDPSHIATLNASLAKIEHRPRRAPLATPAAVLSADVQAKDFDAAGPDWCADVPSERGTFFGQIITAQLSRSTPEEQQAPSAQDLELLGEILANLPKLMAEAEFELQRAEPEVNWKEQVDFPRISIACNNYDGQRRWKMVVERLDYPGMMWFIDFLGLKFIEIGAGD